MNQEMNIADAIIERPHGFEVGNRSFFLYPQTLGKTYLTSRLIDKLGVNIKAVQVDPFKEALRVCRDNKLDTCRLIAYHTINSKELIFDSSVVESRTMHLVNHLTVHELAQLFIIVLTSDSVESFISYLGIDKDRAEQNRIYKKKGSNNLSFGGKSVYGSLIDIACERYGWTMDYVVWGISLTNLRMLLADRIDTVFLSEEEKKTLGVVDKTEVLNADDPNNLEKIKAFFV